MLVNQDLVSVGILQNDVCNAVAFGVRLIDQLNTGVLEASLDFANILEGVERRLVLRPTGVECQDVLLEHPLEESDFGRTVPQNDPVLGRVATNLLKAEFFVEGSRES